MPPDNFFQARLQPGNIQVALDSPDCKDVVEVMFRFEPLEKPEALLRIGQWENRGACAGSYLKSGELRLGRAICRPGLHRTEALFLQQAK